MLCILRADLGADGVLAMELRLSIELVYNELETGATQEFEMPNEAFYLKFIFRAFLCKIIY